VTGQHGYSTLKRIAPATGMNVPQLCRSRRMRISRTNNRVMYFLMTSTTKRAATTVLPECLRRNQFGRFGEMIDPPYEILALRTKRGRGNGRRTKETQGGRWVGWEELREAQEARDRTWRGRGIV